MKSKNRKVVVKRNIERTSDSRIEFCSIDYWMEASQEEIREYSNYLSKNLGTLLKIIDIKMSDIETRVEEFLRKEGVSKIISYSYSTRVPKFFEYECCENYDYEFDVRMTTTFPPYNIKNRGLKGFPPTAAILEDEEVIALFENIFDHYFNFFNDYKSLKAFIPISKSRLSYIVKYKIPDPNLSIWSDIKEILKYFKKESIKSRLKIDRKELHIILPESWLSRNSKELKFL